MADDDREALAAAVRTAGGIRAVASRAGLDPGNLSRYLRGHGGLATTRIATLWETLGRPAGKADARVLLLNAKDVHDCFQALRWHLPSGGQLARMAWTAITRQRVVSALGKTSTPEILAATDKLVRLIVLLPVATTLPSDLLTTLCPNLKWWNDDPEAAVLDPLDPVPWVTGIVDPYAFDEAWPGKGFTPAAEDVITEIQRLRIGYAEAIRRLHRSSI